MITEQQQGQSGDRIIVKSMDEYIEIARLEQLE
jgi:hypothetical protein